MDTEAGSVVNFHPGVPFMRSQARILLKNKYILFLGDSVQRGMYKDLVALIHNSEMLSPKETREKSEPTFRTDKLLYTTEKHNGTAFCEIREYRGYPKTAASNGKDKLFQDKWENSVLVRYAFISKIWNEEHGRMTKDILDILTQDHFPDIICVNSLLWDVTKWGDKMVKRRNGLAEFPQFSKSLRKFCGYINSLELAALKARRIKQPTLKIWRSSMPISHRATGGVFDKKMEKFDFREDIEFANGSVRSILNSQGWDLVDAQFWFQQNQDYHRISDGIHWNAKAHRWLTCIFLSHISEAWGMGYPEMIKAEPKSLKTDVKSIKTEPKTKKSESKPGGGKELRTFNEEHNLTTRHMSTDLTIPDQA